MGARFSGHKGRVEGQAEGEKDDWCRRWDLNPEAASTASEPSRSITENGGTSTGSTGAAVDGADRADAGEGQKRDNKPEHR